ncbi:MAG TPA: tetratricopeptide repeat protein, partial [Bryobacteraceae bacterium]|nr:tetratricopeptide repeat protein [Bryobacteraceae bacterium]
NSAVSPHVLREVERATSKRHPVLALRIDQAPLPAGLEYFLNTSQWLDASDGDIARPLPKLSAALRQAIEKSADRAAATAETKEARTSSSTSSPLGSDRSRYDVAISVGALLAIAIGGFAVYSSWQSAHQASALATAKAPTTIPAAATISEKSVAVLPFVDMSEKKDQEYIADGTAEELLDLPAKVPGLRVIGRTSSFQFKGKGEDLRTIGRTLGATYIVEGSLRKMGERLRVTAQLIGSRDGSHLWSETYDEGSGDAFQMQDQIASGIVRALQVTLGADDLQPRPALNNTEAYDIYLRGRYASDRFDKAGLESAISYFQQALELEPSFFRAAEWLAMSQETACEKGFVPVRECYKVARESTERVLNLNPRSGLMLSLRAIIHAIYDWDWAAATEDAKRARTLEPRNSLVLVNVAQVYASLGRWDEAARFLTASVALDPLFPAAHQWLGYMRERTGRLAEAEAEHRKVLDVSPTYPYAHFSLGWTLLAQGKADAALAQMLQETPDGNRDEGLAIVYYAMRRKAASDAALARFTKNYPNDSVGIAEAHAYRGEADQAFEWLDRAYEQKHSWLYMIKGNPFLKSIEPDRRYKRFLQKMNMTE